MDKGKQDPPVDGNSDYPGALGVCDSATCCNASLVAKNLLSVAQRNLAQPAIRIHHSRVANQDE